jgi:hypothetical protein
LDWDTEVTPVPKKRKGGVLTVVFKYAGRSKPLPVDDTVM